MTKNNYWVRSGSYVFLQRIAIFIFSFGSYFFLVRYFSKEAFGVWALFTIITSVVEMSRSAFIQNAFVKFYSHQDVDHNALVTASLFLNFVSISIIILVLFLLIPVLKDFWHTQEIGSLILWYSCTSIILVPFTQINYIEQASHSFKGIFWSAVVRQSIFFGAVLFVYFFKPGLPLSTFAALQSVGALAGLLVAWRFSQKFLPKEFIFDWSLVRKLFHFGKYILGTGITSSVGKSADQVILGSISHSTEALYNSAIRIMSFIEIPTQSISNVVYPKIAERVNKDGKSGARELYEKSVAYMVAIIIPIILGISIFPEVVLLITAGKNYTEAAFVLQLVVASAILYPFNVQVGSAFEVIGKPHVSFSINLGSNVLNLSLNLLLIYRYGIVGAAWATIITAICTFVVSQWLLSKQLGISFPRILLIVPGAYRVIYQEVSNKLKKQNV